MQFPATKYVSSNLLNTTRQCRFLKSHVLQYFSKIRLWFPVIVNGCLVWFYIASCRNDLFINVKTCNFGTSLSMIKNFLNDVFHPSLSLNLGGCIFIVSISISNYGARNGLVCSTCTTEYTRHFVGRWRPRAFFAMRPEILNCPNILEPTF